jgi:GTPase SAR1 family protein
VCFDITDEQSFDMMKDWVEELRRNVGEGNIVIAIACTKADLEGQRVGIWTFLLDLDFISLIKMRSGSSVIEKLGSPWERYSHSCCVL